MLVLGYQSISQWVDIRQLSPVMSENQFDNVREPATRGPAAKSLAENKPVIVALAVVGLLIITFVGYLVLDSEPAAPVVSQPVAITTPEPVAPPLVPEPEPPVVAPPSAVNVDPVPVPEPAFILPRLDDSDQLVRDGMLSLTREEAINTWLSPAELVRKFVVLVDNVANGNVAKDVVAVLAPRAPFKAVAVDDKVFVMDEANYARFDEFTRIFTSLDTRRAAEFYVLLKPLFQSAYAELGYTDRQFDEAVFRAVGRLLETPVLEGPVRLVRPVVMFEYADPQLESLSAVQKQLLRMGPDNSRAIQAKLGEMARELRVRAGP